MYGAVVSEGSGSGKSLCTYHRMLSLAKARIIPLVDSAGNKLTVFVVNDTRTKERVSNHIY